MRVVHMFNWRLRDIEKEMEKISQQGFDAIQISPLQPLKEEDNNLWWMSYQPIDLTIGNKFGNRDDLKRLCEVASQYGIKIITDVICNHVAGKPGVPFCPSDNVSDRIRNIDNVWKEKRNVYDWNNRNEVINCCLNDLPGLNVSNHELQDTVVAFLNDLIDCGVDGFRFDAAKNIGLPEEGCDFWPRVIFSLSKWGLILYAELIFMPGDLLKKYMNYLNVLTDSREIVDEQVFAFVESHDSYLNDGEMSYTKRRSSEDIAYEYYNLCKDFENTLFYVRPFDDTWKKDIIRQSNNARIKKYAYR